MIHLREYLPRMHLMLSISGLTLCLVIPRVYQNMNLPMSSRQRRSASNNVNMMRQRNVRSFSIHNSMPVFHPFSSPGKYMHRCGQDLTSPCMVVLNPQWLQGPATIMGSPVDPLEGQAGTLRVETPAEDTITQTVEVKVVVVVTAMDHFHLKGGVHHMPQAECLVQVLEEVAVVMELVLQIILKVVHTVVQVLVAAQT